MRPIGTFAKIVILHPPGIPLVHPSVIPAVLSGNPGRFFKEGPREREATEPPSGNSA